MQNTLFEVPQARQRSPQTMMHVVDAGENESGVTIAKFTCEACGSETGWVSACATRIHRGRVCPRCRKKGGAA